MAFLEDIEAITAHELLVSYPHNIARPPTSALWVNQAAFYGLTKKVSRPTTPKGSQGQKVISTWYALNTHIRGGWTRTRTLSLHVLIGLPYLNRILLLLPSSLWLMLDTDLQEANWLIIAIKLYFSTQNACEDARVILEEKYRYGSCQPEWLLCAYCNHLEPTWQGCAL